MPALPLQKSVIAQPVTKIVFETSRPVDAYPERPVHLARVEYERIDSGAFVKTGRREWCGSFPTEELAQGDILKRRTDRDGKDFLSEARKLGV